MQSALWKASERAVLVTLVSLGIAFGSAALTSEDGGIVLYILLAMLILGVAISGLYRRPLRSLNRMGGRTLSGFFAVPFPLAGFIIFALYPLAVGFVATAGAEVRTNFMVVATISGLLALANLVVLTINIVELLRSRQGSG